MRIIEAKQRRFLLLFVEAVDEVVGGVGHLSSDRGFLTGDDGNACQTADSHHHEQDAKEFHGYIEVQSSRRTTKRLHSCRWAA